MLRQHAAIVPGMNEIDVGSLGSCQISADGHWIRLNLRNKHGEAVALNFTINSVQQLLMRLPRLLSRALQAQYADDSMRAVFPLSSWRLETAARSGNFILTMTTPDGFEVSFSVGRRALAQIASAAEDAGPLVERQQTRLTS
jgi:hypothetical protein